MVLREFLFFKAANLNEENLKKKLSDLEKSILIPFLVMMVNFLARRYDTRTAMNANLIRKLLGVTKVLFKSD